MTNTWNLIPSAAAFTTCLLRLARAAYTFEGRESGSQNLEMANLNHLYFMNLVHLMLVLCNKSFKVSVFEVKVPAVKPIANGSILA